MAALGLIVGVVVMTAIQILGAMIGVPPEAAHLVGLAAGGASFYSVGRLRPWWHRRDSGESGTLGGALPTAQTVVHGTPSDQPRREVHTSTRTKMLLAVSLLSLGAFAVFLYFSGRSRDISGGWVAEYSGPRGPSLVQMTLREHAGTISGTGGWAIGESVGNPFTVRGTEVDGSVALQVQMGRAQLGFQGRLRGDTLQGTAYASGSGTMEMEFVRRTDAALRRLKAEEVFSEARAAEEVRKKAAEAARWPKIGALPRGVTMAEAREGAQIFHKQGNCYSCHGVNAKGRLLRG